MNASTSEHMLRLLWVIKLSCMSLFRLHELLWLDLLVFLGWKPHLLCYISSSDVKAIFNEYLLSVIEQISHLWLHSDQVLIQLGARLLIESQQRDVSIFTDVRHSIIKIVYDVLRDILRILILPGINRMQFNQPLQMLEFSQYEILGNCTLRLGMSSI